MPYRLTHRDTLWLNIAKSQPGNLTRPKTSFRCQPVEHSLFSMRMGDYLGNILKAKALQTWAPDRRIDGPCDSHRCSFQITLTDSASKYVFGCDAFGKLDDYLRWRLKLSKDDEPFEHMEGWLLTRYMHAGGRPAAVVAHLGMRDGVVWRKGISVDITTNTPLADSDNQSYDFA